MAETPSAATRVRRCPGEYRLPGEELVRRCELDAGHRGEEHRRLTAAEVYDELREEYEALGLLSYHGAHGEIGQGAAIACQAVAVVLLP